MSVDVERRQIIDRRASDVLKELSALTDAADRRATWERESVFGFGSHEVP